MRDAVIVDAVRAPIGKRNGAYSDIHPADLSAHVLNAIAARTNTDPLDLDDVVWGCVTQSGEQANNLGRNAVLAAGWPETVPATTVGRACGSSEQAVHFAAAGVIAGMYDWVVAGGAESMTRVAMGSARGGSSPVPEHVLQRYGVDRITQGIAAERVADKWGLSRQELDEYSLESHELAAAAIDSGAFEPHLAPFAGCVADEGIRRGGTVESMARLKPAFDDDGVITAGNSSQMSDGAAALLITTSELARARGLRPLARIHATSVVGDDPVLMLTGPIRATEKALSRAGLTIDDIGAFEVNEAFAPVPLMWLAETGADRARLNPYGGAIAVGHPLGASGAILMTRLIGYMQANGIRYGLQTMCEAGGMANATVLELL